MKAPQRGFFSKISIICVQSSYKFILIAKGLCVSLPQKPACVDRIKSWYDVNVQRFLKPMQRYEAVMGRKNLKTILTLTGVAVAVMTSPAFANGLLENGPWQFQTSYDKANKSAVLDVIERKKGGYYDGFGTVQNIDARTYIGAQFNCSNNAQSTGNLADNGQAGPSTTDNSSPNISSDSTGNSDTTSSDATGNAAGTGTVGADLASVTGSQDNSGSIDSGVDGSRIGGFGGVLNGSTDQDLVNDQNNSGEQTAGIDTSTACNVSTGDISGGSIVGSLALGGAPINSP
jgi:hypothetical protein